MIKELVQKIKSGETSAVSVVQKYLGRIKKNNPEINAFVRTSEAKALAKAREIDEKAAAGKPLGRLAGIPIGIKDNMCIRGEEITCASSILKGFVAPYNATVIEHLDSEDALIVGQLNMDEFAMGSSNEMSCYGPVKNPWDTSRIPGGSSGGPAAAVAAGMVPVTLGSDTGGSIRQPAALCGVVGLKPTYGRVSRYGLIAFASSLDQIGPFARNIADAAYLSQCIDGYDKKDSTSIDCPVPDYEKTLNQGVKGLKIGLPKEYFIEGIDPAIQSAVEKARNSLASNGAEIVEVSLPHTQYAVATYYILATAEASSNLARYDGVQYGLRKAGDSDLISMYEKTREAGFGSEVKRRIILGTYVLSSGYYDAYYLKGQKVRTLIKNDFEKAFNECDCILTPTTPTPAFKLGEKLDDPLQMYLSDIFTISANLAGIPGISLPFGFSEENLPLGIQLLGKHFDEAMLFRVGQVLEDSNETKDRKNNYTQ